MKKTLAQIEAGIPIYASDFEREDTALKRSGADIVILATEEDEDGKFLPSNTFLAFECGLGATVVPHFDLLQYRQNSGEKNEDGSSIYTSYPVTRTEAEKALLEVVEETDKDIAYLRLAKLFGVNLE